MVELKGNKKSSYSFPCYGEIYLVYLNPRRGREVGKFRPALVVSNNIQNEYDHHIIVAPLSDESWEGLSEVKTFEVLIKADSTNGLDKDSKILLNRLRAVDKKLRLRDYCGIASKEIMSRVNSALKITLNFDDRIRDN